MKKLFLTLLIPFLFACSATTAKENHVSSFEIPPKLAELNTDNRLSGEIIVYDADGQEVSRGNLTIDTSQVTTPSFDLVVGKTYNFLLRFDYTQDDGSVVTLAYVLFAKEVGSDSSSLSFSQTSYVYDTSAIPDLNITNFIDLPNLDSDNDGIATWTEIDEGTNPTDNTSFRFPFVINSPQDGDTVQDLINIEAEFIRDGDAQVFLVDNPAGISDENNQPQVIKGIWDTTNLPEDNQFTLTFRARNRQGKEFTKQITVMVDNAPNIDDFSSQDLIQVGNEVELAWEVNNHSAVEIEGLATGLGKKGNHRFKPDLTQTYTLKATRTNNRGQTFTSTRNFRIRVNYPPVFNEHTTENGQDPNTDDGLRITWDHSDNNTEDQHTTIISLFQNKDCTGEALRQVQTTDQNYRFQNLPTRTHYSYHLTIQDGQGQTITSPCRHFSTGDRGLIGWWPIDGNFNDFSNSRQNGFMGNGAEARTNDLYISEQTLTEQAFRFGGEKFFMRLSGNDMYNFEKDQDFTIGFWFKTSEINQGLLSKKLFQNDTASGYVVYVNSGNYLTFRIADGSQIFNCHGTSTINDNQWHQAIIAKQGDDLHIYIDGLRESTTNLVDHEGVENVAPLILGTMFHTDENVTSQFYNGELDDVVIYNRALTPSEVRDNCTRLASDTCPALLPVPVHPLANNLLIPNAKGQFAKNVEWATADKADYTYALYKIPTEDSNKEDGTLMHEVTTPTLQTSFDPNGLLDYRTSYLLEVTACLPHDAGICQTNSWRFTTTHQSLAAWWRFNGDFNDMSGNKNHGSLIGDDDADTSNNFAAAGNLGQAIDLDGSDDYVEFNDNVAFDSPKTIEVWLKADTDKKAGLVDKMDGGDENADGYFLSLTGIGNDKVVDWNVNHGDNQEFDTNLNTDTWYHLVFKRTVLASREGIPDSNEALEVYLDGTLIERKLVNLSPGQNDEKLIIGGNLNGVILQNEHFDGQIGEVALYNRSLSLAEIRNRCLAVHPSAENCKNNAAPAIQTPLNGGVLPPTRAYLSWEPDQIPEGKTLHHYRVCYSENILFPGVNPIANDDQCGTECSAGPNPVIDNASVNCTCQDTSCVIHPLVNDKHMHWKVATCYSENPNDCSEFSPVWDFIVDNSVAGWYKFDDENNLGLDSSNNDEGGSFSGRTTFTSADGLLGNGLLYPDDPEVEGFQGGSFTLSDSVLANPGDSAAIEMRLMFHNGPQDVGLYQWGATRSAILRSHFPGRFTCRFGTDADLPLSDKQTNGTPLIVTNQFYHHVCSYDGSQIINYTDGTLKSFKSLTGNLGINTSISFGGVSGGTAFNGMIDEIILYNRGITLAEHINSHCSIQALLETDPMPLMCQ